MQAHAAHGALLFDNGDPFAEFSRLDGTTLARRPTADTDEIIFECHRVHA